MTTLSSPIVSAKPSDLVFISQTNKLVTDSFHVSQYFGKRHDDVLKKIRALACSHDFTARNFTVCHKNNELQNGKLQPFYQMTKNGFMFLVMGFTGKRAAEIKERYINAFDQMAEQLRNKPIFTPVEENTLKLPDFSYQRIMLTVESGNITQTKILSSDEMIMNRKQFINYFRECPLGINQLPELFELSKAVTDRIEYLVDRQALN